MSFNFIAIVVELNQINALTFTGNPFLTSEFEITHILFSSLKFRHFYLNRWILSSDDIVVWLHFTKTFTNFRGKKPNGFQVIAFYTPEVKLRTYYGMAFVRPSVRPSVRPLATTCPLNILKSLWMTVILLGRKIGHGQ